MEGMKEGTVVLTVEEAATVLRLSRNAASGVSAGRTGRLVGGNRDRRGDDAYQVALQVFMG
jgi:hypothetical protein